MRLLICIYARPGGDHPSRQHNGGLREAGLPCHHMRIVLDLFLIYSLEVRVAAGDSTHLQLVSLLYRDHRDWLLGWLRTSIHVRGRRLETEALVRAVTGEGISPRHLVRYLGERYLPLCEG